ncbi:transposase [Kibdelosporangium lantanae]|uniref:Transposase n=1 Tax=Kibdelosporangium lantanae TaxID=1497396 RepID=A0ABW3M2W6_9PSEU
MFEQGASIAATRADALPGFGSYLNGVDEDHDATVVGLTLPCSNGPTEGVNSKIKLLKRQTYGKASVSLLRKRIPLS